MNKYGVLPLTLMTIIFSFNFVKSSISEWYYLTVDKTISSTGFIKNVKKIDDIGGTLTYTYDIDYFVNGELRNYKQVISMDSLIGKQINDTVGIRISAFKPEYVTLTDRSDRNYNLIASVAIIILLMAMSTESIQLLKELKNKV